MTESFLRELFTDTMVGAVKLSLPMLVAGLGVGLVVSLLQAVTQVQEMTLTFVPKVVATVIVIMVAGPWMLDSILAFTRDLYSAIPSMSASAGG